jgi:hypothetical protein
MATVSIPAFHVSDKSQVKGQGEVFIQSRKDAAHAGTFIVELSVQFDPAVDEYPTGNIMIRVDMSDSAKGVFIASSVELINSYGKHNPTVYITGRCRDDINPDAKGCRYWLEIANNRSQPLSATVPGTPDIVGFAVHDNLGNRIAYGCGPLRNGDFVVAPK